MTIKNSLLGLSLLILCSFSQKMHAQQTANIPIGFFDRIFGYSSHAQDFENYVLELEGTTVELIAVKGGSFEMGCTAEQYQCSEDEIPAHEVILSDFYIGKYEVTNAQFCAFLNSKNAGEDAFIEGKQLMNSDQKLSQINFENGQFVPAEGMGSYPVVEVSYFAAKSFCQWAGGRLPTEAEWEYAARGGQKSNKYTYSGSSNLDDVAWHFENTKSDESAQFYEKHGTMRIGQKKPNELGIYDMSGNVYEWCNDVYTRDYYGVSEVNNPKGPKSGDSRVLRGGSWGDQKKSCRLSFRISVGEYTNYFMYGLRLVKDK
ncbi:MAG: SUMF1/EgtB/PvdO family nonheme iron enzyme [Salinivirgaceae bacterium]|nr:SUMF1/EgtB/PvdO family nonheme iron enzyme [Salinivirgaceae bacterium]